MNRRSVKRLFHLDRFGKRMEESLDAEVQFHLQTRIQEFLKEGLSEEEARERALEQFGDPDLVLDRCRRIDERHARRNALIELRNDLLQDVRFAFRSLAKTRGFSLVAIISLACGIGAFVAYFAVVHATSLSPVPGVSGSDRAVELLMTGRGGGSGYWDYPDFRDLRATPTPLEEVAGWKDRTGTLTTPEGGEQVALTYVSANYFRVLGVIPVLGRAFLESEDTGPGQHPVAVVGHDTWQDRFGGDPEIIGRTVTLNRSPYTVVGVAPEAFKSHLALHESRDFWIPLMQDPWVNGEEAWTDDRDAMWLQVLGRIADGVSIGEVNAALQTVFFRLEERYPETNEGRTATAHAFGPIPAAFRYQTMLGIGMGFGLLGLVLLIICGNVAGMVLARSIAREKEIAIRLALGSGRLRLARLLLVEALLIAVAGGGLGVLLGRWGMDLASPFVPGLSQVVSGVGAPVLSVALAVTLVTTLGVGLLPSIRFSRPELVSSLKDDAGGGGRKVGRIHRYSASAQAGLALCLLVTSFLFLRALGFMELKDLGFEPVGLYTVRINLTQEGMETRELAEPFLQRVRESVGSLPGVTAVSIADGLPLDLTGNFTGVSPASESEPEAGRIQVEFTLADEGFFETIGTPVLQGRGFEAGDDSSSEPVAVVTEALADRLFHGENVLGRRVRSGAAREGPQEYTIVGVVPDLASSRPTEEWPNIFLAFGQNFYPRIRVNVRGRGDPLVLSTAIRDALLSIEPNLAFPVVESSESLIERATRNHRFSVRAAGGLGVLALLLAAIGVYGVVAFAVSSRTREIGLRMAMGATRGEVLRQVLRDGVLLALPGLLLGGFAAVGVSLAFRAQFFGLSPLDPVSFLAAAGVLFAVVLVASISPARRASAIDPMRALRME
jgi:predicted permease